MAIEKKPDIAIFSAGGDTSLKWAPKFAEIGTIVIDNSSAWRMDPSKKLIIPEINGDLISKEDMIIAANKLIKFGVKNVLIKGGHLKTKNVEDVFLNSSELKIFKSSRYKTKNTHGTGCTLSSAITTFYSCGKSIKKACELGIKYVNSAILTNPKYGKGNGPINHLNSMKISKKFK